MWYHFFLYYGWFLQNLRKDLSEQYAQLIYLAVWHDANVQLSSEVQCVYKNKHWVGSAVVPPPPGSGMTDLYLRQDKKWSDKV